MIWITSDSHYHHKNICKGVSLWEDKGGCRDFNTLEEMDKTIVDNINAVVKEDDELYHLGDWSFGGIENVWNFRKQIKCKNIHLILGNHDHHIENNRTIIIPEADIHFFEELFQERMGETVAQRTIRCENLFSSVSHYKEVKINGRRFVLCHYPIDSWRDIGEGAYMLHGHVHGNMNKVNEEKRRLDVGIDSAYIKFGAYKPFCITEINCILGAVKTPLIDHHK